MRTIAVLAAIIVTAPAWAQSPAASPAAGSGGGGGVGASGSTPTAPTGTTPPGAPSAATVPGQIARDQVGQSVIGQTATPPGAVPGDPGKQGTGTK